MEKQIGAWSCSERRRAATLDRAHHLQLLQADPAGVGPTPGGAEVAEDVRDLQPMARHGPGGQAGALAFFFFLARPGLPRGSSGLAIAARVPVATRV